MKGYAVLLLAALAGVASAQLSYEFDSDAEGWRQGDFSPTALTLTDLGPATYNPAGYIEGNDFAGYAFHLSPVLASLDLEDAYGTPFTLDYATEAPGGVPGEPFIVLTNGTGAIFNQRTFATGIDFTAFSYALDTTGGWFYGTTASDIAPATETQIRSVLSGLTRIGITADVANGADFTRVDNISLGAVPEPATLAALGLGAIALLRRRRAR